MRTSESVEHLWTYIQSLSLSKANRKWLSEKLIESVYTDESPTMTKEEISESIQRSFEELKLSREGKITPRPAEELLNEL